MRKIEEQRGHPRQVRGRDPGRSTVDTTGPMPSEVWTVRAGRAAIIVVRGDLDIASADEPLGAAIRVISENSRDRILVDLADVNFMDAAGLAAVIRARGLANSVGIPLDLVTPSQAASRLLRLTHTERSFRIHDSLDAAMEDSTKSSSAVLLNTAADPRDDSDSGDSPDADETEASSSMDEEPPPRNDMTGEQPNRMKGGRRARTDAA